MIDREGDEVVSYEAEQRQPQVMGDSVAMLFNGPRPMSRYSSDRRLSALNAVVPRTVTSWGSYGSV